MKTSNYDNMTQKQLRPACKAAGIKYGKMNITQMREALIFHASEYLDPEPEKQNNKEVTTAKAAPQQRRAGSVVQNDIRQPGEGTKCRAVWDAMDELAASSHGKNWGGAKGLTVGTARVIAEENGWNINNTVIEFYQWRKFHGFSGRVKAS